MKSNKKHILSNKNLRNIYNLKSLKRRRRKQQKSIMRKRQLRLRQYGGSPPSSSSSSSSSTEPEDNNDCGIMCCIDPTKDIKGQCNDQISGLLTKILEACKPK